MNGFACVKGSLSAMRRDGTDKDQLQEKGGGVSSGDGGRRLDEEKVDEEIKRHGS